MDTADTTQTTQTTRKPVGPTVAIIVILLLLALGALYIVGGRVAERADKEAAEPTPTDSTTERDPALESLQSVGTSDELDAIDADLNATTLNSLDAETGAINAELNGQ
ncbi:MAG: hypothetical protein Q8R39_02605 [bacterium]|nr:hypothetical protein [bacterium]MDZ4284896.1 hypothetical protein [Patescibacteria group bacterium]